MNKQHRIRKKILQLTADYFSAKDKSKFIPGETSIPYGGRVYSGKELISLIDASLDFWLTSGRFAKKFEKNLADFLGIKYCLLTNSGSSANLLAVSALTSPLLKSRRLKPGDEVITTACGFPTTLNPIIQNGLIPVFVDIELGTYNIRAKDIEKAVTKKTKTIFIAHTLGNPVNLREILRVCAKYNLWFIEDNCDALGSEYDSQYTGTFGHIATCSFYPAHHITMGEGGAVLTDDPLLRKIIMSFRDWGRDCWCNSGVDDTCGRRFSQQFGKLPFGYDHKYVYSHIGYNLKATDLQAAIGCAQIKKLPGFIKKRKSNFRAIYAALSAYTKLIDLPEKESVSDPSWFGFPIRVKENAPFSRAEMVNFLESKKIATRMLFGGNLIKQPAYQGIKCRVAGKLSNTDKVMNSMFWVGVYPGITEEKLAYLIMMFKLFLERYGRS